MASDLKVVASLDISKSVSEINKDIPKLEGQLKHLNIKADLDSGSLTQIKTTLKGVNDANIKVGVDVGNKDIVKSLSNDLNDVSRVSQTVSDEIVKNFNKAFGLSQKITQEAKSEIRSSIQDTVNAWNTGDLDKYSKSMQKLIDLTGQYSTKITDPGIKQSIETLRSELSDGSKVYIFEDLRKELQAVLGDANTVKSVLSNVFGVGKWTYDRSKGGISTDRLIGDNTTERLHDVGNAIVEINERIVSLQQNLKGTTLDEMFKSMSPAEVESHIRDILQLSDVTENFIRTSNGEVFANIIDESGNVSNSLGQVKSQILETGSAIKNSLSGKYFSDNNDILKNIQYFNQEEDAIRSLTDIFTKYGATVSSVEKRSSNGKTDGFSFSVQSATGAIEKFEYKLKNINAQTKGAAEDWRFVLQNITASDKSVQKLVQDQKVYQDQVKSAAISLQSQLEKVKSSASIGSKPIDFDNNESLNAQYNEAINKIKQLEQADKTTMASMQANATAEIEKLKQMVAEVRNAEYAATSLRDKQIGTIKDEQVNKLNAFINSVNNSKVPVQMLSTEIDNLRTALGNVDNKESLTNFLNQFDIAKSKFDSFKELFKGIGQYTNSLDKMASEWKKQGVYTDELKTKVVNLRQELSQIAVSGSTDNFTDWVQKYNSLVSGVNINPEKYAQLNNYLDEQVRLTKIILSIQTQIANLNSTKNPNKLSELQQQLSARQNELSVLQQENSSMEELMSVEQQRQYVAEQTLREQERLSVAQSTSLDNERKSEALTVKKANALKAQISSYEVLNSKAAKLYKNSFDSLNNDLALAKTPEEVEKVRSKFVSLKAEIKAAGKEGKTFWQTIKDGAEKFSSWMTLTSIISAVARDVRKMVTNVIELDTAMTNLKKVTDETETSYSRFLKNTSHQAKELHTTMTDLVEQTATWAKLGFSLQEAESLAKISMIYSKVGEVSNDTAVSDLVTTMKAFNIESSKSIRIVDALNILGNSFATDAASLGEGLTKSASALSAANNSFEQSVALLTGGTEITQNANEMGSALKVISMRIRGMKGALQELGEEYEGIESISKIQTQILNLSNGKVNIFDDNNNFRSTYDILKDISEIYDSLSDPDKADLTEILFGKMRGNQGIALIQAFQSGQIEKAYETAKNSAGSAQEEFDRWSQSIEAHIETFKASFESLSNTVVDSDSIKFLVDSGTNFLSVLDKIIDRFGTIPTLLSGIAAVGAFKNVGELNKNTPVYALSQTKYA